MHNIVWHQCAANILWEEQKVMRNLPLVLLLCSPLPPAPLGAFPVNSSEASGSCTVIGVKLFFFLPQLMFVGI